MRARTISGRISPFAGESDLRVELNYARPGSAFCSARGPVQPLAARARSADLEQEAAAYLKKRTDQLLAQPKNDIHYDDAIWQTENYTKEPNRRTSPIVDPPDGKLPSETPEARKRAAEMGRARESADSAQGRSLAEARSFLGYRRTADDSADLQRQSADCSDARYGSHHLWMIHDVRIIPVDSRPHIGRQVRSLAGDSRGRWEGDTLVVDTTNFTDKTNFLVALRNTRQDIFTSESLHVVERFTLAGPDQIHYQSPSASKIRRPGRARGQAKSRSRRFDGPLYEDACHEGNYSLRHILINARAHRERDVR